MVLGMAIPAIVVTLALLLHTVQVSASVPPRKYPRQHSSHKNALHVLRDHIREHKVASSAVIQLDTHVEGISYPDGSGDVCKTLTTCMACVSETEQRVFNPWIGSKLTYTGCFWQNYGDSAFERIGCNMNRNGVIFAEKERADDYFTKRDEKTHGLKRIETGRPSTCVVQNGVNPDQLGQQIGGDSTFQGYATPARETCFAGADSTSGITDGDIDALRRAVTSTPAVLSNRPPMGEDNSATTGSLLWRSQQFTKRWAVHFSNWGIFRDWMLQPDPDPKPNEKGSMYNGDMKDTDIAERVLGMLEEAKLLESEMSFYPHLETLMDAIDYGADIRPACGTKVQTGYSSGVMPGAKVLSDMINDAFARYMYTNLNDLEAKQSSTVHSFKAEGPATTNKDWPTTQVSPNYVPRVNMGPEELEHSVIAILEGFEDMILAKDRRKQENMETFTVLTKGLDLVGAAASVPSGGIAGLSTTATKAVAETLANAIIPANEFSRKARMSLVSFMKLLWNSELMPVFSGTGGGNINRRACLLAKKTIMLTFLDVVHQCANNPNADLSKHAFAAVLELGAGQKGHAIVNDPNDALYSGVKSMASLKRAITIGLATNIGEGAPEANLKFLDDITAITDKAVGLKSVENGFPEGYFDKFKR